MLSQFLRAATLISTPPTLQFGAGTTNTTASSSYTFSNLSIGTANTNRYVVVIFQYRIAATFTAEATVTVAGQACNLINVTGNTANPHIRTAMYITNAPVTSGTTANVVATASATQSFTRGFISTYALTKNGALVIQQNLASAAAENPSIQTSTLTTGQVGIFVAIGTTSSTLTGLTVTGPVTNNYTTGIVGSAAALNTSTITGSGNCQVSVTGTGANARSMLVTWR